LYLLQRERDVSKFYLCLRKIRTKTSATMKRVLIEDGRRFWYRKTLDLPKKNPALLGNLHHTLYKKKSNKQRGEGTGCIFQMCYLRFSYTSLWCTFIAHNKPTVVNLITLHSQKLFHVILTTSYRLIVQSAGMR